jgi:hypothetical protein
MQPTEAQLSIQLRKHFYRPFCTESEIERVLEPQNARDYLLKIRADYIADHMRVFRYFRRRWLEDKNRYSLEGSFRTAHYRSYLSRLMKHDRELLANVTFGDVFTQEPNGTIFNSPFGRIVTISHSLQYFLEFSHLALLDFEIEIPQEVRFNALLIALRVMFQKESLDFDVDPRGKIPSRIYREMRKLIPTQLEFIAGHEFAHHLLGHLSEDNLHIASLSETVPNEELPQSLPVYSTSETEEFNADLDAFIRPRIDDAGRARMLNAALIWFGALELFQHAKDTLGLSPPWRVRTHPSARDRHLSLLKNVPTRYGSVVLEISESVIRAVDNLKQPVSDFLSLNVDQFETYGSFYLSGPNTKWRGRELIDRVDYY